LLDVAPPPAASLYDNGYGSGYFTLEDDLVPKWVFYFMAAITLACLLAIFVISCVLHRVRTHNQYSQLNVIPSPSASTPSIHRFEGGTMTVTRNSPSVLLRDKEQMEFEEEDRSSRTFIHL
jgi:hypothetical protein